MRFRGHSPVEVARAAEPARPDVLPADEGQRRGWVRSLAQVATVYGLPAVLQHDLLRRETGGEDAAPLSTFRHERAIATARFSSFRVPNVDTLYSSAWLDLTGGPVDITLPDFGPRYFTLQLVDAFSEVANLSRRTIGATRRLRLVPPGAEGSADPGDRHLVHVASPVMWVLMRIQVGTDDVAAVHALQDQVRIEPCRGPSRARPGRPAGDVETDWRAFFATLDAALRLQGHPPTDAALVAQFRGLGVLVGDGFTPPAEAEAGMAEGFADAMAMVSANRSALGVPTPGRWTRVKDKGRHGHNHLNRAIMAFVGLGANVEEENTSFNTYADADGHPLDGRGSYEVVLDDPPDTDAFWSITLYEAGSGMLHDAPQGRHSVGSASGGRTVAATGRVVVGPEPVDGAAWLPTPPGPFFLVLRTYAPGPEVVSGAWTPPSWCPQRLSSTFLPPMSIATATPRPVTTVITSAIAATCG